jgi:hypothetical protein
MHSEHHRIFAATFLNTMLRRNYSKAELDLRFLIFFLYLFSCFLCLFFVFFIVLCIVSPFVYSLLFPIFVQVYRPPLPGGNPFGVNKYHIISFINYTSYGIVTYRIVSYHITYHIINRIIYHVKSYRIISYHITSYHFILYHIPYGINGCRNFSQ